MGKLTLTGGRGISTGSDGSGKGGDLTVNASESVFIDSGGLYSDSSRKGDGGKISIKTPSLVLDNSAGIAASTSGEGNAGSVLLDVGKLTLTGGGGISTSSSGSGKGGDLTVKASESVFISGLDSEGFSRSGLYSDTMGTGDKAGDGGAISIKTPSLVLDNGGDISAEAIGKGNAGSVSLDVGKLTLTGEGCILTDSWAREKVVILQLKPLSLSSLILVLSAMLGAVLEKEGQSLYLLLPWFWITVDILGQKLVVKEMQGAYH